MKVKPPIKYRNSMDFINDFLKELRRCSENKKFLSGDIKQKDAFYINSNMLVNVTVKVDWKKVTEEEIINDIQNRTGKNS